MLPRLLRIFVFATAVSSAAVAQTASYSYAGTACTGGRHAASVGPVPFSVEGLPRLGGSFDVLTEGTHSYVFGVRRQTFLLTGSSNTAVGGIALPFDLTTIYPGQPVCGVLRTSGEISLRMPVTPNFDDLVRITVPIPNDAALLGATFHQQAISIEFSSFTPFSRAISLSRGGTGVVGR